MSPLARGIVVVTAVLLTGVPAQALAQPGGRPGDRVERRERPDRDSERGPRGPWRDRELTADEIRLRLAELDRLRGDLAARLEEGEGADRLQMDRARRRGEFIRAMRDAKGLTEDDLAGAIAFANEVDPERADRLRDELERNPQMGKRFAAMVLERKERIDRKSEEDDAFRPLLMTEFRAEIGVMESARQLRELRVFGAGEAEIDEQKGVVRERIGTLFDAKLALRAHEIERAQARIDRMRAEHDREVSGRDAEVAEHFERLLERVSKDD